MSVERVRQQESPVYGARVTLIRKNLAC